MLHFLILDAREEPAAAHLGSSNDVEERAKGQEGFQGKGMAVPIPEDNFPFSLGFGLKRQSAHYHIYAIVNQRS